MTLEMSERIFEIKSNVTLQENPSIGNRVIPCGRMDGRQEVQTEMTKLIVAFRNFEKASTSWLNHVERRDTIRCPIVALQYQQKGRSDIRRPRQRRTEKEQIELQRIIFLDLKVEVKVKGTVVQALRLCTGRTAYRGSSGIALPFHDHSTRRG
jgi:hypothetical protein